MKSLSSLLSGIFAIAACAFLVVACGANEGILKSGRDNSARTNATPRPMTFAQELEEFRTADFRYIYVLRRKDGGEIDAEDRSVIKLNTMDANRRVSADSGKAFIIGTNQPIPRKNLLALYESFAVEDYSPPVKPQ